MTHRSAPPSRKDFEAMMAALSPYIVLHSPVTLSPFEGLDAVTAVQRIVFDVFGCR